MTASAERQTNLVSSELTVNTFKQAFIDGACNISNACKKANISRQTYYNWLDRIDGFATFIEDERESLIDFAESQLLLNIKEKNQSAIQFFLRCQGAQRGWVEKNIQLIGDAQGDNLPREIKIEVLRPAIDGQFHELDDPENQQPRDTLGRFSKAESCQS